MVVSANSRSLPSADRIVFKSADRLGQTLADLASTRLSLRPQASLRALLQNVCNFSFEFGCSAGLDGFPHFLKTASQPASNHLDLCDPTELQWGWPGKHFSGLNVRLEFVSIFFGLQYLPWL